ncbi:TIGR04190 family B12-binding domain/radical SAM domain protein [Candidatus Desantisbacteria bacterium]|nr:TIGR04190 family B12-binding domain/radical SAM domain protein [Candidatus Desantisbacteria bacterium]
MDFKSYKYDLVLLHAPSVYDFRKTSIMYGPISDVVPSSSVFEMYPIGFATISRYLKNKGFRVRILNLAVKMLLNPEFDPEKFLKKINARAFGIDLHWLCHAHGSVEVAKLVKKLHPDSAVIFGGISATYFNKELMEYPFIDYCIRGDSTELLLEQLLIALKNGTALDKIENLCWKNDQGEVIYNPFTFIPDSLDGIYVDYKNIFLSAIKDLDFSGYLPFASWVDYPVTALVMSRGCNYRCNVCGGSNQFYQNHCSRKKTVYRSPEDIGKEIKILSRFINGPLLLIGDVFLNGKKYSSDLFDEFERLNVSNQIIFELSAPPARDELEHMAKAIPSFNLILSPESHDERVRSLFGRNFTNKQTEEMIETSIKLGVGRIDLFFMIGLPEQTRQSVRDTIKYCDYILGKYAYSKKVAVYIAPMAPFLDPGSTVFEDPEKYGYKLFYKTLEQHRMALLQPSWKYILNYETKWMTRDDIVESSYEAAIELNRVKMAHGIIEQKKAISQEKRIIQARDLCRYIDKILENKNESVRNDLLKDLKQNMDIFSVSTICNMKDLEWAVMFFGIKAPKFVRRIFFFFWSLIDKMMG